VTCALGAFLMFCAVLLLHIQHHHTLDKVRYRANRDVIELTWFQKMLTQVLTS